MHRSGGLVRSCDSEVCSVHELLLRHARGRDRGSPILPAIGRAEEPPAVLQYSLHLCQTEVDVKERDVVDLMLSAVCPISVGDVVRGLPAAIAEIRRDVDLDTKLPKTL